MLRHDEHVSISISQAAVLHRHVGSVHVDGIPGLVLSTAHARGSRRQQEQQDQACAVSTHPHVQPICWHSLHGLCFAPPQMHPPTAQLQCSLPAAPVSPAATHRHVAVVPPMEPMCQHTQRQRLAQVAFVALPCLSTHLPAPHIVNSPRTKSTGSAGIGSGRHLRSSRTGSAVVLTGGANCQCTAAAGASAREALAC